MDRRSFLRSAVGAVSIPFLTKTAGAQSNGDHVIHETETHQVSYDRGEYPDYTAHHWWVTDTEGNLLDTMSTKDSWLGCWVVDNYHLAVFQETGGSARESYSYIFERDVSRWRVVERDGRTKVRETDVRTGKLVRNFDSAE
jgi:hypothetical protein